MKTRGLSGARAAGGQGWCQRMGAHLGLGLNVSALLYEVHGRSRMVAGGCQVQRSVATLCAWAVNGWAGDWEAVIWWAGAREAARACW